jgi:3-hydroxybutyryl-CoA dehydrogenase
MYRQLFGNILGGIMEGSKMKKIGVLGTGTMGAGIIQVLAQAGFEVVLRARRETSVEKGIATVTKNLEKLVAKEKITADEKDAVLARVKGSTDIAIVADADLIIEAATEEMESKKTLFKELDELCKPGTIIATNTSSLSITEIAAATGRPDKIIGMHFFNPVPAMKLVEIIKGIATSDETRDTILELTRTLGKTPVEVNEAPGFVVNRILIPMINEGIGILADGVAKAEDIDEAMKLGANHPIGPLALGDLVGLDVCLAIMEVLYSEFGDSKYRPHPLLKKMVRAGKLGRKSGEGFFEYTK